MSQNRRNPPSFSRIMPFVILAFVALNILAAVNPIRADQLSRPRPVQRLKDLSGLAWIGGDNFLGVHDAKNPDENSLPRVSFLVLPRSLDGILWRPLHLHFPGGRSNDLESASRIPGTNKVLLVESSHDDSDFKRIFLAKMANHRVTITDTLEWDSFTEVFNVEATAVAETNKGWIFIWAERNQFEQSTDVDWIDLTLNPFVIGGGGIATVKFTLPDEIADLYSRAIVAMDVDNAGKIYTAAAFDPEGTLPDPDNGPFRSVVFKIGQVVNGRVELDPVPTTLATLDGLKVESVAVRQDDDESLDLFVGTDDENYGGTLRLLPPLDLLVPSP